jgi:hypothetical protein
MNKAMRSSRTIFDGPYDLLMHIGAALETPLMGVLLCCS